MATGKCQYLRAVLIALFGVVILDRAHGQITSLLVNCPNPVPKRDFTHGTIILNIYTVQKNANARVMSKQLHFTCNEGYALIGHESSDCLADGTYSSPTPTCVRPACPEPRTIANGIVQLHRGTEPGHKASYGCNPGYELIGLREVECLDSLSWSAEPPTCKAITCPQLTSIINGHTKQTGTIAGSRTSWTCNVGYTLVGDAEAVCRPTGEWSRHAPTCRANTCTEPANIINGQTRHTGTVVGSRTKWTCKAGYTLVGDAEAICQSDGRWSRKVPTCRAITCPTTTNIINGQTRRTGTVVGSRTKWTCNAGYTLVGDAEAVCHLTGEWSRDAPTCRAITCPQTINIINGQTSRTGTVVGSRTKWTCNVGYTLVGDAEAVCQLNGKWSREAPTCEVRCGAHLPTDFLQSSRPVSSAVPAPACGQTAADVIVVCDESDSMSRTANEWLHQMVQGLDQSLRRHGIGLYPGIPNQYSLVGFGRGCSPDDTGAHAGPHTLTDNAGRRVYSAGGFREASSKLVTSGSLEDGYLSVKYALENITDPQSNAQLLRLEQAHIAPIIILVTDEDRDRHADGVAITRSSIKRIIRQSGAQVEAIVDNSFLHNSQEGFGMDASGVLYTTDANGDVKTVRPTREYKRYLQHHSEHTRRDYTSVALELGGAAWDVKKLLPAAGSFNKAHMEAFVGKTVKMVEQKVHKCCLCRCSAMGSQSYLQCSSAAIASNCNLRKPANVFQL